MVNQKEFTSTTLLRKHRPTTEKLHAPFRGVTSKEDVVNGFMGIVHDLYYVQRKAGLKDDERGLLQQEQDNTNLILFGEGEATTNLPTAGTYCKVTPAEHISQNLMDNVWTTSSGVVKKTVNSGVQISSDGLLDPAYISQSVSVKTGDCLYIRLKIKKVTGKCDAVKFGSDFINSEGENLKTVAFSSNDFVYVDHKLYCNQNEVINLRIYPHYQGQTLEPTTIQIDEFQVQYLEETPCSLPGLNQGMRHDLQSVDEVVRFIHKTKTGG